MTDKTRLDKLLVDRRLYPSRQQAQAAIMAGRVWVNGRHESKAGLQVTGDAAIEIRGPDNPYVSRGGLKLAKALSEFGLVVEGRTVLDIGASTGGFTDCLLQHGAKRVYAVDVGYGQLHWKLRNDPRVINLERCNMRHVSREQVPEPIELCTADVSFISLAKVLQPAAALLSPSADVVSLIKPQFEAGPERVGKGGIVRDAEVHRQVLWEVCQSLISIGFSLCQLTFSPIRGGDGNIEFLAHWRYDGLGESSVDTGREARPVSAEDDDTARQEWVRRTVQMAHDALGLRAR